MHAQPARQEPEVSPVACTSVHKWCLWPRAVPAPAPQRTGLPPEAALLAQMRSARSMRQMERRLLDRALSYVDSWLRWRCPRADLPGCAAAVGWRGKLVFSSAYGYADVEGGRRLEPDHVFRIASHSKTFTATAVMQLAEQGLVVLDNPVADHLEWLGAHSDRRFREVTVRQLLSHGAGVIRDGLDADFWQLGRRFPSARQLRDEVLDAQLVIDPNTAMKYSNFGYGLLGMVIEAASGQSFAAYVDQHICRPLGLASTAAEPTPRLAARGVTGYTRREAGGGRRPIPAIDTRALAPATGFASTAEDLCRYFGAHFVGSKVLLADASKREMQRVQWHALRPGPGIEQDYGLGLQLETVRDHTTFGHSGGFPGHITRTFADARGKLVVSVLTNCIDGPASDIGRGILRVVDAFGAHPGASPRAIRRFEGRYVNLFNAVDLVASGTGALATDPNSWNPFEDPDRLEPASAAALRVADGGSFGSTGELVEFDLEGGEVRSVRWTGTSMWPERRWPAAQRRLLRRR
jgi:D-alanyl-D-alanine carboxypeptidase